MKISVIQLFLILSILSSCENAKNSKPLASKIFNTNCKELIIKGSLTDSLQYDSIFSEIKAIPLETNENCLINQIDKVLFYEDKMLILDQFQKLYIFDIKGKFLYEIAKQGRGPGEYLELRNFDIDKDGNIYLLDFQRILKYDLQGKFLESIPFVFLSIGEIYCNPLDFALINNGNFLLWGGSFSIKNNPEGKLCALYEMTSKGEIVNKYFPLKHIIHGEWLRFRHFDNSVIMNPPFGSNMVYSFNGISANERYRINFGEKTMNLSVVGDFNSIRDFYLMADQNYYHSISKFTETDDWIFFSFNFQRRYYNVYYSKKLNKSFVSTPYPFVKGYITPWTITSIYEGNFIGFADAKYVIEQINTLQSSDNNKIQLSTKANLERLKNLLITDNPVLLIAVLKKY
jgi:hypothetical protein